MTWTPHRDLSAEELIARLRGHDDPLVQELTQKLITAQDEESEAVEALGDEVRRLEEDGVEIEALHKHTIEDLEDTHQAEIEALKEDINGLRADKKELADENRLLTLEIEDLRKNLQARWKEITMLEDKIDALTEAQAQTNKLLEGILNAVANDDPEDPTPVTTAKAKPVAVNDEEPETVEDDKTPAVTLEDVREALMAATEAYGRDAALEIVNSFTGGVPKVSKIEKEAFADVIAACAALDQKEAA